MPPPPTHKNGGYESNYMSHKFLHGFFIFVLYLVHYILVLRYCQTLSLVLRLRVDFVLPLSQEEQEEQQEQPLTKIYQKGMG